jgi:hypothetical protein
MKYFKKYKHDPSFHSHLQISTAILVIVVIAAVGAHLLVSSHAQSPYSAAYAANGTLGGVASLISGGSNVNDQAVQFGSAGSGQNITGSPAGISVGYTFTVNWANEAAATRATIFTQAMATILSYKQRLLLVLKLMQSFRTTRHRLWRLRMHHGQPRLQRI